MTKLIAITGIALLLTACGPLAPYSEDRDKPETPAAATPPQINQSETPQTPQPPRRASIDWTSARADFASAQAANPDAMVEIASGPEAPPVPVILPQMAGIASSEDTIEFRPLGDGYFAILRGETYDMLINGTDRLAPTPPGAEPLEEAFRFEETMTGAQVSFKRYGASYLVEFACKDPATAVRGACIGEEEALNAVNDMIISGTQ